LTLRVPVSRIKPSKGIILFRPEERPAVRLTSLVMEQVTSHQGHEAK